MLSIEEIIQESLEQFDSSETNIKESLKLFAEELKNKLTVVERKYQSKERAIAEANVRAVHIMMELEDANHKLEETQEQLLQSQKLDSVGKLAAGVAHEFNNILGGILGYASMLRNKFKDDLATHRKLDTIVKGSERATRLTAELLGVSRKGEHEKTRVDINHVVKESDTLIQGAIKGNVSVHLDLAKDLKMIRANNCQISQIIINLIINAKDAMPHGGEISVSTQNLNKTEAAPEIQKQLTADNYVVLRVQDTGEGMSDAVKSKIFDPFYTTKEVGKGTGLGLFMVFEIIGTHDGIIHIDSKVNEGTTFHLLFPVYQSEDSTESLEDKFQTSEGTNLEPTELLANKNILVVDDESFICELAQDILDEKSAKTFAASQGEEALKIYRNNPIDLVILDITMPVMDGIETFKKIKEIKPEAKVLFISGYAKSDVISEFCKDKQVQFIQKPFTDETLIEKLLEMF